MEYKEIKEINMELEDKRNADKEALVNARLHNRPIEMQISQEESKSISEQQQEEAKAVKRQEIRQKEALPIYQHEEAEVATKAYFDGDQISADVWLDKYALRDLDGNLREKMPTEMHHRLAKEFARIEKKYPNAVPENEIFELLDKFQYIIPQGSPMFGIGNRYQISSLSNCFVIGHGENADSYGGIMKIDEEQVQLMKRRGGVGHDLSHIRPKGSIVHNSARTSTGVVSFMERYSNSTKEVAQEGRRGALMLSISVKHPDVESFIDAKLENGKVTGANISVKIDDEFMRCVHENRPYEQQYPVNSPNPIMRKKIDAGKLWNKIIHNAWKSAEPGILFWDTIKKESIPDCYAELGFASISTNPCGEIPLCPYDSCRLLSVNLYSYVNQAFTSEAKFDFEKFKQHIRIAQRLMDDLVDLEIEKIDAILDKIQKDPEEDSIKNVELNLWKKIKEKAVLGRRTGLGVTAEGDMLAALGIRYGTQEAIDFSTEVHKTLALAAYRSSVEMAKERGKFAAFNPERERNNPFIQRINQEDPDLYAQMMLQGRRNISLLTLAPGGSVSICTQTTSGIEPVFSIKYKRRRKVNPNDKHLNAEIIEANGHQWVEYDAYHPKFLEWAKMYNYDVSKMNAEELEATIAKSPYANATSHNIDYLMKVRMQGAIQKWVDHSISVTINMPNEVSEKTVDEVYKLAWEVGCKGMTIYRDGSRGDGIITHKTGENAKPQPEQPQISTSHAPKRPVKLKADVIRFYNENAEKWVAFVGLLNNRPYEIFTGKEAGFYLPDYVTEGYIVKVKEEDGSKRYDFHFKDQSGYEVRMSYLSRMFDPEYWNYAKLISGVLRHGMPLAHVNQLIKGLRFNTELINSWKNGVTRALEKYDTGEKVKKPIVGENCPQCGEPLIREGKCKKCTACNYQGDCE
ncbi:MAG: adenosylcobalamin-dependent ribonucleoside-diphosphate reductase [Bacteroidales bacterium]|nr:adenosylcobalamin-dependent ribonucleoside-diphosphate reductase [Bacteroidales bacterium]